MKKKILITGGAGFIGSHLSLSLVRAGYSVRILDNFAPQVHGGRTQLPEILSEAKGDVELLIGDVRSEIDVAHALEGVDSLFHFAAAVGVGQSMYEVRSYVDTNNMGTATLMQALIRRPIERLVVASSMSIYGEGTYRDSRGQVHTNVRRDLERVRSRNWEPEAPDGSILRPVPTAEEKTPDLASVYALSKYDQERLCLLLGKAYGIGAVALRFFNVYGRGQALSNPYTGVMAIFASRLLNNQPPLVFEDGEQKRDFVHVSDVVRACRLALEEERAHGQVLNVGSGSHYTVREIAQRMAWALGKGDVQPEITSQYRVGDIRHCFADIRRIREVLGFVPSVSLNEGIRELADWLAGQRAVDRTAQARDELMSRGLAI